MKKWSGYETLNQIIGCHRNLALGLENVIMTDINYHL